MFVSFKDCVTFISAAFPKKTRLFQWNASKMNNDFHTLHPVCSNKSRRRLFHDKTRCLPVATSGRIRGVDVCFWQLEFGFWVVKKEITSTQGLSLCGDLKNTTLLGASKWWQSTYCLFFARFIWGTWTLQTLSPPISAWKKHPSQRKCLGKYMALQVIPGQDIIHMSMPLACFS